MTIQIYNCLVSQHYINAEMLEETEETGYTINVRNKTEKNIIVYNTTSSESLANIAAKSVRCVKE